VIFEFQVSKVGKTVRGSYDSSALTSIELVSYTEGDAFRPTSFAVKLTKPAYMRQSSSPGSYTLEEEIPANAYIRVDVESPDDRYLYLRGTTAALGFARATEITHVAGTTPADTTQYGIVASGALASGKQYGAAPYDGLNVSGTSALTTVSRYSFASDALTAAGVALSAARTEASALGSATYAYIGGGQDAVGAILKTSIERYCFGTDVLYGLPAVFAEGRAWATAAGNGTVGITHGGRVANTAAAATDTNRITSEKLTYATEAITAGTNIYNGSAASDNALRAAAASPTVGYWRGGGWWSLNYGGVWTVEDRTTYRYTFATDVVAGSTPNMSAYKLALAAAASPTEGIWAGGTTQAVAGGSSLRNIEVLTFATLANVASSNVLATARRMSAALSNSTLAIFVGGYATGVNTALATSEKITFGTAVATTAAALSTAMGSQVGASDCHGGIT
jgi:hypothetical protein